MAKRAERTDKTVIMKNIARNLRVARETAEPRLSQRDVAKRMDLSRAAVGQWEVGDTLPDVDKLALLAKIFGRSIDSLVFSDDYVGQHGETVKALTPKALVLAQTSMKLSERQQELILSVMKHMAEKETPTNRR